MESDAMSRLVRARCHDWFKCDVTTGMDVISRRVRLSAEGTACDSMGRKSHVSVTLFIRVPEAQHEGLPYVVIGGGFRTRSRSEPRLPVTFHHPLAKYF